MVDRQLDRDWNSPVRYPDPAIEVLAPRFARYRLGNAAIERIWTGGRWNEGPVWFGALRSLIWSDIPHDRLLRWAKSDEWEFPPVGAAARVDVYSRRRGVGRRQRLMPHTFHEGGQPA